MDGSVTIRIFQVINTFNIFRNDFLNIVQCPAGANRHTQAKLVRRLIIRAGGQGKVVRVVNQVQRERIDRGCVACQLLADLQLTGCVRNIGSTGRGRTQSGIGVIGFNTGVVPVGYDHDRRNRACVCVESGRGIVVIGINVTFIHHDKGAGCITGLIRVPLLYQLRNVPIPVSLSGIHHDVVNGIGAVIFRHTVAPGHCRKPVVIAGILGGQIGSNLIHTNGERGTIPLHILMLIQAQRCTHYFGTGRDRRHIVEVHKQSVTAIVCSAVGLGTHIQILATQCCIIGCGFHGVNGIDFVQSLTGNNGKGRIDLYGENTLFIVDPFGVGFHCKDKASLGFVQCESNILRDNAGIIFHIRDGNLINGSSVRIQEADGAILILLGSQAVQIQQEAVTVAGLRRIHHDLLFQVVTISSIEKVRIREYVFVNQRGLQCFRNDIFHIPGSAFLKIKQSGIALDDTCRGTTVIFQRYRFRGCFRFFWFCFRSPGGFRLCFLRLCLRLSAFRLRSLRFSRNRGFLLTLAGGGIGTLGVFIGGIFCHGFFRIGQIMLVRIVFRSIRIDIIRGIILRSSGFSFQFRSFGIFRFCSFRGHFFRLRHRLRFFRGCSFRFGSFGLRGFRLCGFGFRNFRFRLFRFRFIGSIVLDAEHPVDLIAVQQGHGDGCVTLGSGQNLAIGQAGRKGDDGIIPFQIEGLRGGVLGNRIVDVLPAALAVLVVDCHAIVYGHKSAV